MSGIYTEESLKFGFPSAAIFIGLCIIFILIVLAIIVGIQARHTDYKKSSKGLLMITEWAVEKLDNFVLDTMGEGFENFGGILLGIIPFLFLSFTIGITGLPTPMNSLAVPLSLALVTFCFIHYTAMRYNHLRYFKRFIEPFPFFLPINLISMWAPLISMTIRMFGNAIVGWVLLSLVNWSLESVSASLFSFINSGANQIFLVPIATPLLHAYFDLFSGFIQTMVFVFLTALFIAQEKPEDIEDNVALTTRKEVNK